MAPTTSRVYHLFDRFETQFGVGFLMRLGRSLGERLYAAGLRLNFIGDLSQSQGFLCMF
jgi:hypothetical protein